MAAIEPMKSNAISYFPNFEKARLWTFMDSSNLDLGHIYLTLLKISAF